MKDLKIVEKFRNVQSEEIFNRRTNGSMGPNTQKTWVYDISIRPNEDPLTVIVCHTHSDKGILETISAFHPIGSAQFSVALDQAEMEYIRQLFFKKSERIQQIRSMINTAIILTHIERL